MIRVYQRGDAWRVMVQHWQLDEAVDGVRYFDNVGKYSLIGEDGKVLAVFGYVVDQSAVDCYALVGGNARRGLREAVRFLKRSIPMTMRELRVCLARMTVKKGFSAGERFALMLGFYPTEILPKFYNENDYQLFERMEK
ncbi:MAG: hypothetical protein NC218_10975 [Acetobacter sp.]|nr:hypothetical protein [Acetobacter sp.]